MGCNCRWTEAVIAIVVIIAAAWPEFLGRGVSSWVVIIAAVILLIHALKCKNCANCINEKMPVRKTAKIKSKKRRR